jgi:hypothetical protein
MNDIFVVNQHDKWLRYSLSLHISIEPFSGHIIWIRVWHSNQNLQLILSYYLDILKALGHKSYLFFKIIFLLVYLLRYMPMVTQSNFGSKNFKIANTHTMFCQWHDPVLQGILQHSWMWSKKNTMPEIIWLQL